MDAIAERVVSTSVDEKRNHAGSYESVYSVDGREDANSYKSVAESDTGDENYWTAKSHSSVAKRSEEVSRERSDSTNSEGALVGVHSSVQRKSSRDGQNVSRDAVITVPGDSLSCGAGLEKRPLDYGKAEGAARRDNLSFNYMCKVVLNSTSPYKFVSILIVIFIVLVTGVMLFNRDVQRKVLNVSGSSGPSLISYDHNITNIDDPILGDEESKEVNGLNYSASPLPKEIAPFS